MENLLLLLLLLLFSNCSMFSGLNFRLSLPYYHPSVELRKFGLNIQYVYTYDNAGGGLRPYEMGAAMGKFGGGSTFTTTADLSGFGKSTETALLDFYRRKLFDLHRPNVVEADVIPEATEPHRLSKKIKKGAECGGGDFENDNVNNYNKIEQDSKENEKEDRKANEVVVGSNEMRKTLLEKMSVYPKRHSALPVMPDKDQWKRDIASAVEAGKKEAAGKKEEEERTHVSTPQLSFTRDANNRIFLHNVWDLFLVLFCLFCRSIFFFMGAGSFCLFCRMFFFLCSLC
jgi:hypothetical protein